MKLITSEMPDICKSGSFLKEKQPLSLACLVFQWDPEFMYEWMICKQRGMLPKMQCRYNCPLRNFTSSLQTNISDPTCMTYQISAIAITRALDRLLLSSICRNQVSMGTTGKHLFSHPCPGPIFCCSVFPQPDEAWDPWDVLSGFWHTAERTADQWGRIKHSADHSPWGKIKHSADHSPCPPQTYFPEMLGCMWLL